MDHRTQLFLLATFQTVAGVFFTYVAVGLARTQERKRGFVDCERRLEILRRSLRRSAR